MITYDSNRLRTVEFNWGFLIPLSFINSNWKSTEKGIYYISRIFGNKETSIYIGQTVQSFSKRIGQHLYDKTDFLDKRGDKFIRMGTIVMPKDLSGYDNEQRLLKTIESAIIIEVNKITNRTYYYDMDEKYVIVLEPLRSGDAYYLLSAYYIKGKDAQRNKIEKKYKRKLERLH